jgi:peptidoglycan/LPS O-acetylase OafA/YrhL
MENSMCAPTPSARFSDWLAGFRRITTSGNYIPEIDGLRFIAIGAVVLCHCSSFVTGLNGRPPGPLEMGARGVELFFAISGFVLAMPFANAFLCNGPKVDLGKYFLRRLTRLEPPFLLALLLAYLVRILLISDEAPTDSLIYLGASSLYLNTVFFGATSLILVVTWSLEIEVQFYILMPLLAYIFLVRRTWLRRGILLAAMVGIVLCQQINLPPLAQFFQAHAPGEPLKLTWWRHIGNFIQFFLAGILLADIYITDWRRAPSPSRWGDLVWCVGWPMLVVSLAMLEHVWARLAFPLLILVIYLALFRSVLARRLMSMPLIATIGGMCYSIYLIHILVIQVAGLWFQRVLVRLPFPMQLAAEIVVMIPLILIVCGLFYRLIEQPCMRRDWPRRAWAMLFIESEPAPKQPGNDTKSAA